MDIISLMHGNFAFSKSIYSTIIVIIIDNFIGLLEYH